jgi:hypothetical protein
MVFVGTPLAGALAYYSYLSKHKAAYETALATWQRLWFCTRCGYVIALGEAVSLEPPLGSAPDPEAMT